MTEDSPAVDHAAQAIEALTVLAERTRVVNGFTEPGDFADTLAQVLAAVAANIGSAHALVSGRPGSWESDLVLRLVLGTVGEDDAALPPHRTRPIVLDVDVEHELWHAYGTRWDDAWEARSRGPEEAAAAVYEAARARLRAEGGDGAGAVAALERWPDLLAVPKDQHPAVVAAMQAVSEHMHRVDPDGVDAAEAAVEAVYADRVAAEGAYRDALLAAAAEHARALGYAVPVVLYDATSSEPLREAEWELRALLLDHALAVVPAPPLPAR